MQLSLLGKIRIESVNHLENLGIATIKSKGAMNFVWVLDFPLFQIDSESNDNKLVSSHHPFTAPHPEDLHFLDTDPLQVKILLIMNMTC